MTKNDDDGDDDDGDDDDGGDGGDDDDDDDGDQSSLTMCVSVRAYTCVFTIFTLKEIQKVAVGCARCLKENCMDQLRVMSFFVVV